MMLRRIILRTLLLIVLPGALLVCSATGRPQENVTIEWRFDTDGDFRGWVAGGHIGDAAVTGGALAGQVSDWDPILLGPVFEIRATPTQRVEIKMKATQGGRAQLFWTETLEGKFGGFGEAKSNHFEVRAGEEFRVYRIHPFWHAAEQIIRLRLDPPGRGRFEIQWIRIVDQPARARSEAKAWKFEADPQGWRAWQDVSVPVVREGCLQVTAEGKSPIVMSPILKGVAADENPYVSIRMATDRGSTGRIYCVSSGRIGWEDMMFPLVADGKMHSYNVDVGHLGHWQDEIIMLGVQPTDAEGGIVKIESIEITDTPRGPAELEIAYFGRAEGVNRAGRPAEITMTLRNRGGRPAENVTAMLFPPAEVDPIGPLEQRIESVTRYCLRGFPGECSRLPTASRSFL